MRNKVINHGITIIGIAALAFLAISCASKPVSTAKTPAPTQRPAPVQQPTPVPKPVQVSPATEAFNRGNAAMNAKNYDQAIEEFTEVINLDPNYTQAYINRSRAYEQKDDFDRAIADCNEAIRLGDNSARQSLERLQQAQQKAPAVPAFNRGMEAYSAKSYDKAIAEFTEAISLFPNYAEAYTNRGRAYEQKRDYNRAIADYNEAVQRGDTNARQNLQQAQQAARDAATGRNIRLGILAPEGQGLGANLAYLPAMVQGVLVSNISKYSDISVLDRISLDKVIAETLDPTYEDNLDIVRLGHVAQVGHMLTGKIIRTSSGYTMQLNITDTTPEANTAAAYSGTCTVA